jgi:transcription initiation factor IIE alpha subunit
VTRYVIECPFCSHKGSEDEFGLTLADECFCPKCKERLELDTSIDEDDVDDEEDDRLSDDEADEAEGRDGDQWGEEQWE